MMPDILMAAADRLADVLDRENEALRAMDLRRATILLPEKVAAIANLGEASPGASHQSVTSVAQRLENLTRENRRLLERAIAAQQRVIGIVVRAAASAAVGPSYGARGRRSRQPGPMALSTRA